MPTTIRIKITNEILKESLYCGKINTCKSIGETCAFALAVRDIFPNAIVLPDCMIPFPPTDWKMDAKSINISKEMKQFIKCFDDMTVSQRTFLTEKDFNLELPDWVIDQIDISSIVNSLNAKLVENQVF